MPNILPMIIALLVVVCFQTAQPRFPKRFSEKGLLRPGKQSGSTPANPAWFLTSLVFVLMAITTFANAFAQGHAKGFTSDGAWWVALLGIVGVTLLGAILSMIRALQVWSWDADGLEWRGLFRKTKVSWSQAARFGRTWDGGWYLGPEKGPSVTWSRVAVQAPDAIMNAVRYAKPELVESVNPVSPNKKGGA